MAKPGKKAELDKEGIAIPERKPPKQQASEGKQKVELDKDGINIPGRDKVQLDKDGINIGKQAQAQASSTGEIQEGLEEEGQESAGFRIDRRKLLIIASSVAAVVLLVTVSTISGILWYKATHKPKTQVVTTMGNVQSVKTPLINEGDIPLEPFMVLYTPQKANKTGVLTAQVRLQVNPKLAPNVNDRIYEIRTLISETLNKNAGIYTQFEISDMLKEELRHYDVADVSFAQYDLK